MRPSIDLCCAPPHGDLYRSYTKGSPPAAASRPLGSEASTLGNLAGALRNNCSGSTLPLVSVAVLGLTLVNPVERWGAIFPGRALPVIAARSRMSPSRRIQSREANDAGL